MNEYYLYLHILAPRLQHKNQTTLTEENEGKIIQKSEIVANGIDDYTVYRYSMKEDVEGFLPFFNNTHDGDRGRAEYPAPKELLKFCDYIILVCKQEKLYIILIEMKSGGTEDAAKQLHATEIFMNYIRESAERIKFANDCRDFSSENIHIKKIILKPAKASRPTTNKAKRREGKINWNDNIINLPSGTIPLLKLCM